MELCNIDVYEITDNNRLQAWHQSVDSESPDAAEILGHLTILRSITWLEEGNIATLYDTMQTIGRANMNLFRRVQPNEKDTEQRALEKQNEVIKQSTHMHADEVEDGSGQERDKLPSGIGVVESESGLQMQVDLNVGGERNTSQGETEIANDMYDLFPEVGGDVWMASQVVPNVDVKSEGSGAAQVDGTIVPANAMLKRKRETSVGLFCSEVSTHFR